MAQVKKGGVTSATKSAGAATQKVSEGGNPERLRALLDEEKRAEMQAGVVFASLADHLFVIPPKPIHNKNNGDVVGQYPGLYMDFGGIGKTRTYDITGNSADKTYVDEVREVLAMDPPHPDVVKYNIRELKPADARPPFKQFDTTSAEHIKVVMLANLGDDHDSNVLLVKEAARYERENGDRSDVLAILDGLIAQEAAVGDAFDVEVSLS